jgi:DNA repair exonuclease SbcCD ATPase subunit
MTSPEDRVQTNIRLPVATKQAIKEADGPMWKVVEEGVRMALGLDQGSTEAAIEARLEEIKQERNQKESQLQDIEKRLDELADMEEKLAQQLEQIREKKASHRERLDTVLASMEDDSNNRQVTAWMSKIREAAMHEYGGDSKENIDRVIGDLRQRATEEGLAIAPERFSRTASSNAKLLSSADGGDDEDFRVLKGDDGE